jgi:4-hydroxybenzoate polyprenyltransferase/phosphoserine phosphatase
MTREGLTGGGASVPQLLESGAPSRPEAASTGLPLVVDVDGTLTRSDLLWEGLFNVALRTPFKLLGVLRAARQGKCAVKEAVARHGSPAMETLPLESEVLRLMERAHSQGRPVLLVSGACNLQVQSLAARVGATAGYGSGGGINLVGDAKLGAVRALSREFDYVGNGLADLPLWAAARSAYAVGAGPITSWVARRRRPDLIMLPISRNRFGVWTRALRVHQWVKNTLLLLPALAAHLPWTSATGRLAFLGLLSWSLVASGGYLLNDLLDLSSDRQHEKKRFRPLASGELSLGVGLAGLVTLWAAGMSTAWVTSPSFAGVLGFYLVLSVIYSTSLKQRPILDVLVLAVLYTSRVVGGAVLFMVPLSRWFLAFSVFLFLSLAVLKRVIELQAGGGDLPDRGYQKVDFPVLVAVGVAAAIASSLVFCLYITSTDVVRLYRQPDLLWLGLPVLLYGQARMWLLAGRNKMNQDPVVFSLTDRPVLLAAALFLLIIGLAGR